MVKPLPLQSLTDNEAAENDAYISFHVQFHQQEIPGADFDLYSHLIERIREDHC